MLPPQLFTDLNRTATLVRAALLTAHPGGRVTADQLQALSLRPSEAGTTTPLTCYPTETGLHCLVDDGALTPDFQGRLSHRALKRPGRSAPTHRAVLSPAPAR